MKISTKAKLALFKRTAPRHLQWLMNQIVSDTESMEVSLRKRIQELETELWFWKDKYQDEFLSGKDEEKL